MNSSKEVIIQIVQFPFTSRDEKRFGIHFWIEAGYEIYVFDLSQITFKIKEKNNNKVPDEINKTYIKIIKNIEEFKSALRIFNTKINLIFYTYPEDSLIEYYLALKDFDARIILANPGGLLPNYSQTTRKTTQTIFQKIKKAIFNPGLVYKKASLNIKKAKLLNPDLYFASCDTDRKNIQARFQIQEHKIISSHMHDYDEYLKTLNSPETNNHIVFIDENMGINHSEQITGQQNSRIDLDAYYKSMCLFFDFIEKKTGLDVVISISPRSDYQNLKIYGNRQMIKGETPKLVSEAKFIIQHGSTALSYSVLNKKPVFFVLTDQLQNRKVSKAYEFTHALAHSVDQEVLNVDNPSQIEKINFGTYTFNQEAYASYQKKYITCNANERRNFWQIISDELKQN